MKFVTIHSYRFLCMCDENSIWSTLSNFQVCDTILLITATWLFITSLWHFGFFFDICFIIRSLYLLIHFTYLVTPSPCFWQQPIYSLYLQLVPWPLPHKFPHISETTWCSFSDLFHWRSIHVVPDGRIFFSFLTE